MSNSLLSEKSVFRKAFLFIKSELDIETLGKLISEKLAGGLPFGGLEEYIRDEVPAVYINNILGCRLILLGFPGELGYNLELVEYHFPFHFFEEGKMPPTVDMSGNLYHLLKDIEGITVQLE
jgi:hypothetical protein